MGISSYSKLEERSNFRKRVLAGGLKTATSREFISGNMVYFGQALCADGELQQTYSLNHPGFRREALGKGNIGGPFWTRKVRLSSNAMVDLQGYRYGTNRFVTGPLYPASATFNVVKLAWALAGSGGFGTTEWISDKASMDRGDLNKQGTKMMLAANPSQPAYRSADALAELWADQQLFGIPGESLLSTHRRSDPGITRRNQVEEYITRQSGFSGEYLNLQFAILPIVSDVKKIHAASLSSEAIMAQFLRDAKRSVARSRHAPTSITSESSTAGFNLISGCGQAVSTLLQRDARFDVRTKLVRDVWFEGSYRNLMSEKAGEFEKQLKAWNAVFGFTPNPKSLWEATPFSWLVDYFVNAQDFIHATFMAGIDGSVLERGYVMCKTIRETEYEWTGDLMVNGSWKRHELSWTTTEIVKQRESALPYGIGFTGNALSAKQLSVLAALGISRFAK